MKITSTHAILDVRNGRNKLAEHFDRHPRLGPCPENLRIPVVIHGYIDDVWSTNDGTSQEFSVTVEKVEC